MKNHEQLPTHDEDDLTSPKDITLTDQTNQLDDHELLRIKEVVKEGAKGVKRLPWYSRGAKAVDNYLRKNEKALLTVGSVLLVIACVAFLFIAKRYSFYAHDSETPYIPLEGEIGHVSFKSSSGNANGIKTYVPPFLDMQFENPTPYYDVRSPRIDEVDSIPKIRMSCYLYSKDHLNIIIRDAENARYEIPHEAPFPFPKDVSSVMPEDSDFILDFEFQPFNMIIKRKSTKEVIFSLSDRFVYTNLYLEVSFFMPTKEIYGLGERISPLQYKDGTYSLFIIDRDGTPDTGKPGWNGQGHHSMYLCREISDFYHVMLFKNIAAQEIVVKGRKITWKAIGGVYDFHFFLGESPEDAVRKYHTYIGGWTLPAFWHMGYHQSKWWGYENLNHFETVLERFDKAGLPMDVLWSDIDVYEAEQNFKFNEYRFPPAETKKVIEKYNKRWIPVVQAIIPTQKSNPVWQYNNGDLSELILKDGRTKDALVGYEFSGFVNFIDFLHPKTSEFWQYMLEYLNSKMPASGFWLDANEVSNFMNRMDNTKEIYYRGIAKRKYYKLPFYPGGENLYDLPIVELDSLHYGGVEEFNVRSLTAFYQSKSTYEYLKNKNGTYFPFVLSRGNMFGMGQYAFHFIPDVRSSWEMMRASLGPMMTFQILGTPMVGADVCGFLDLDRVDSELCVRWHQLAVFYTFARNNHAPIKEYENWQEPYMFNGTAFTSIKESILLRYSMLKQFYTYFFTQPGKELRVGTVMKPLFFEFYRNSWHDTVLPEYGSSVYEEQFMVSDAIMVAPVLFPKTTSIGVYFPKCKWYDLRNGDEIPVRGEYYAIFANIEDGVPHFLRGGKLILKQDIDGVRSTEDLDNTFNITVGLSDFVTTGNMKKAEASGIILDVPNYSEEVVYKQCATESCLMNITIDSVYEDQEFKFTLSSISHNKQRNENPLQIKAIQLLGVPKAWRVASGKVELQGTDAVYDFTLDISTQVLSMNLPDKITLNNDSKFVFTINTQGFEN